jgi:hypothetical protein
MFATNPHRDLYIPALSECTALDEINISSDHDQHAKLDNIGVHAHHQTAAVCRTAAAYYQTETAHHQAATA